MDDYASDVDEICCGKDGKGCPVGKGPAKCTPGCAVALHQFTSDCKGTLKVIMPASNDMRMKAIMETEKRW